MRYFTFTPTVTGTYTIASTNCSGDPYGYLYSFDQKQLAYDDDGNGNYNFKTAAYLAAGTKYIIGAKMYSTRTGEYTLTITPPENTASGTATIISEGTPIGVRISAADQTRYYRLNRRLPVPISIASTDNNGDPYGCLYSVSGVQLAYNDDGNGNLNFKMEYRMDAGVEYIIRAKMYSSGVTGSYTLMITPPAGEVQEYSYDANGNRKTRKETKNGIVTETTANVNIKM